MTILRVAEIDWSKDRAKVVTKIDGLIRIMWIELDVIYVGKGAA